MSCLAVAIAPLPLWLHRTSGVCCGDLAHPPKSIDSKLASCVFEVAGTGTNAQMLVCTKVDDYCGVFIVFLTLIRILEQIFQGGEGLVSLVEGDWIADGVLRGRERQIGTFVFTLAWRESTSTSSVSCPCLR